MTAARTAVLAAIAAALPPTICLLAVDGSDGSGKTWFAEALRAHLRGSGRAARVVHVDDFHRLRAERYARGRDSPEGFSRDSYDYDALRRLVLEPVRTLGRLVPRWSDLDADALVEAPWQEVEPGAVVIVEGIFLLRPELAGEWDLSVHLDVPVAETVRRMASRDGTPDDPTHSRLRRYVEGQRLYAAEADPLRRAAMVVDNTDPAAPLLR